MKRISYFICLFALVLAAASCRKPPGDGLAEGALGFSGDTVYFDTLFTTFDSPSERLIIRNLENHDLLIEEIYFEKGSASDFEMIFDGIVGERVDDYVLGKGDSAVIFLDFNSDLKDAFARDRLLFVIGDQMQDVDLEAYVMDAYFHKDETIGTSTTWTNDKPHVIDGCAIVDQGVSLTIQPGTMLHFTGRQDSNFNLISAIKVLGSLKARGSVGNPITFQQSRFGENYEEAPGQWRGLLFGLNSTENILENCLIKNALIGVEVDYGTASGFFPKLRILKSEIRNMGYFGILGIGYSTPGVRDMIQGDNSLIHNCQLATFRVFGGGQYQFRNCTFVNYSIDFSRNSPQIILNNYDPNDLVAFELKAHFKNCIVWGTEEEEYAPDTALIADIYDFRMENCILRTTLPIPGSNNQISQNLLYPEFVSPNESEPDERDYHLRAPSPAVGTGQNFTDFFDDKDGVLRTQPYDIGCYEYVQ